MKKRSISIVTGCYNESGNITEFHSRVSAVMATLPQYDYEIICIDNCSTDGTQDEIRAICARDPRFKAIFNVRNFGHIRSPWHAFTLAQGDAVIGICSDLQDPPELIPEFIKKWEEGYKLALGVRASSAEQGVFPLFRKAYYRMIKKLSDVEQISGFTGFALYDKEVVDTLRFLNDPYPYTRGLIAELGWKYAKIPFHKPVRVRGFSKGNFLVYFDMALLGIVTHSKLPLRIATFTGLMVSGLSFLTALYYLIGKLIWWDQFQAGIAPAFILLFFMMGLLFLFLGLIGEYVGFILTHVVKRPLVVEETRINWKPQAESSGAPLPSQNASGGPGVGNTTESV